MSPNDIYLSLFIAIAVVLGLNYIWQLSVTDPINRSNYPHIKQIDRSIKAIHKHLPVPLVKSFSESINPQKLFSQSERDPVIVVNRIATQIIQYLKLPACRVFVSFKAGLPAAGMVELTRSNEYFVELRSQFKHDHLAAAGIIAHEATHILLHREGLWLSSEMDNEILTDTASAYLGVGWLALNAYTTSAVGGPSGSFGQTQTTYIEKRIGYLTPAEFGYVLGKRALWFSELSGQFLTSPAAQRAFKTGFKKAQVAYHQPPLQHRNALASWLYSWNLHASQSPGLPEISKRSRAYQFETDSSTGDCTKVVFSCPACSQKLRLPVHKIMTAQCGNCKSQLKCQT